MNEEYKVISEWGFWDGKQSGLCERNGKRYVYWLHDWSWDGLYPVDDDGHDLPRTYDLYDAGEETFSFLDPKWSDDAIDAWLSVREPVLQCTEDQLKATNILDD